MFFRVFCDETFRYFAKSFNNMIDFARCLDALPQKATYIYIVPRDKKIKKLNNEFMQNVLMSGRQYPNQKKPTKNKKIDKNKSLKHLVQDHDASNHTTA